MDKPKRDGTVSIHDTKLMVWEESVNEPEFQSIVWGPLIRFMRDRGWTIGADPVVKKHYRPISQTPKAAQHEDA